MSNVLSFRHLKANIVLFGALFANLGIAAAKFVAAAKFAGARRGYVFKRGSSGVGYYLDARARPAAGPSPGKLKNPKGALFRKR